MLPCRAQALLRGVAPGSFPCALGPEPEVTRGMRRVVVLDENIDKLYGHKIRQVGVVAKAVRAAEQSRGHAEPRRAAAATQ